MLCFIKLLSPCSRSVAVNGQNDCCEDSKDGKKHVEDNNEPDIVRQRAIRAVGVAYTRIDTGALSTAARAALFISIAYAQLRCNDTIFLARVLHLAVAIQAAIRAACRIEVAHGDSIASIDTCVALVALG